MRWRLCWIEDLGKKQKAHRPATSLSLGRWSATKTPGDFTSSWVHADVVASPRDYGKLEKPPANFVPDSNPRPPRREITVRDRARRPRPLLTAALSPSTGGW